MERCQRGDCIYRAGKNAAYYEAHPEVPRCDYARVTGRSRIAQILKEHGFDSLTVEAAQYTAPEKCPFYESRENMVSIYASYEYYTESFAGALISEEEFPRLAQRASRYLDRYTMNRIAKYADLDAVKMACCAIAEQYQVIEQTANLAVSSMKAAAALISENGELQSETVGSHSKSYRSGGDTAKAASSSVEAARARLGDLAREYLAGTGLLYSGVRCVQ